MKQTFDIATDEMHALVSKLSQGDRSAFDALYTQYRLLVFGTALQVLHSQEDAEDTTQEIFSKLWNHPDLYSSQKGRLASWLTTMAKNRSIDRLRSRERRSKLRNGFEQETQMEKGWQAPDPSLEVEIGELGQQARSAVMELTPEQQEVINLAYFEGLTQQEIATKIGTPLGTVKARIRRGLGRLKGIIVQ
jgi:RNA polymerase sigma-70 factor (ECF subfamily)